MPSNSGEPQEQQLFDYLRFRCGCWQVIEGDPQVRAFLGMREGYKCADALGLHQPMGAAGPRRITVAESKGTNMKEALEQLGNAAAGVLEKFGRETQIDLLVMIAALQERPEGALSPAGGFRVEALKTGRSKFSLQQWGEGPPLRAQAKVTYPEWSKWFPQVASLRVVVLVLNGS